MAARMLPGAPVADAVLTTAENARANRLENRVYAVCSDLFAAVAEELGRQERSVQVAPFAADELAAGDDDEPAGPRGHTAGRIARGVTISVFTPPTGRRRVRPFSTVTRFSGRSSVIHSFRAVKSCFCP